ncbi:hypothetical protein JVU11DRAFT_10647 [Chiua virens]|nr:hypothetical protein JVU11DRAFT_10647 [Chiua virens]
MSNSFCLTSRPLNSLTPRYFAFDYTALIGCMDQLSPTGGSFELCFSRCTPLPAPLNLKALALPHTITSLQLHLQSNPHEEAEPYLHQIL